MQTLKEARNYAYDLVDQGKTQYYMLDDFEKSVLTGHIMASTDKIHIWEYITEADYKNELPEILEDFLTLGGEYQPTELITLKLIETLRNNAIKYAANESIKLLEEQVNEWEIDRDYQGE